jgi:hypothetical protein
MHSMNSDSLLQNFHSKEQADSGIELTTIDILTII